MIPQANYYMTAPEFRAARERIDSFIAKLPVIKISLVEKLIQKMLLQVILGLQELLNNQIHEIYYFAVFVVHTGHLLKLQSHKIFKTGTPSELLFASH